MKSNGWLPYTVLDFIPYGKVSSWTDPSTNITNLYCQHGKRECELNALHACIVEYNTVEEQLEMINCLLEGYRTDVDVCSKRLHIDVSVAKNCKNTRTVNDILKKYGDKTLTANISFVPSISMNGVFDKSVERNFSGVFSSKYKETCGVSFKKC